MKCFVVLYGLKGGAPRSLLQHIKALKKNGFDEIVCLTSEGDDSLLEEYHRETNLVIIRETSVELWDKGQKWNAYREYRWEYYLLKQEKPQLVVVLGGMNGAFYSYFCKKLEIPLIVYIAGGDNNISENVLDLWEQCEVICFSKENEEFISKHFNLQHIHVISNRIAVHEPFTDIKSHYKCHDAIHILIVSRLDVDKIQSIYSILKIVSNCTSERNRINIRIAGNGSEVETLRSFCATIRNPFITIELLGHVDRLIDQFEWAHIVAGKGRSVIEPIMMNRIGCIIGENGEIDFCTINSFENLYYYNFSGRNMDLNNSVNTMNLMLRKIKDGEIQEGDVLKVAKLVQHYYSAEYLSEQLSNVLAKLSTDSSNKGYAFLLIWFIRVIMNKMKKNRI